MKTPKPNFPNFFLAGCQKSASTWLWKCFQEHPEIYVPDIDRVNYFNIHYFRGEAWYEKFYQGWAGQKIVGDTTPEYFKDPFAPQRMFEFNPQAKLIFIFRNPIDRAFSMYWHQKTRRGTNYSFEDVLHRRGVGTYQLFEDWILTGFYHHWLQNYLSLFPPQQVKVLIYEDILRDAKKMVQETFRFLAVDDTFVPSVANSRVNAAGNQKETFLFKLKEKLFSQNEYQKGVDPMFRKELQQIFESENQKLAKYLGRSLHFWK